MVPSPNPGQRSAVPRTGGLPPDSGVSQPVSEGVLHRWTRGAFDGHVAIAAREIEMPATPVEIGEHGGPQVRACKPGRRFEPVEDIESAGGSLPLRHGDRPIQCVNRTATAGVALTGWREHSPDSGRSAFVVVDGLPIRRKAASGTATVGCGNRRRRCAAGAAPSVRTSCCLARHLTGISCALRSRFHVVERARGARSRRGAGAQPRNCLDRRRSAGDHVCPIELRGRRTARDSRRTLGQPAPSCPRARRRGGNHAFVIKLRAAR